MFLSLARRADPRLRSFWALSCEPTLVPLCTSLFASNHYSKHEAEGWCASGGWTKTKAGPQCMHTGCLGLLWLWELWKASTRCLQVALPMVGLGDNNWTHHNSSSVQVNATLLISLHHCSCSGFPTYFDSVGLKLSDTSFILSSWDKDYQDVQQGTL